MHSMTGFGTGVAQNGPLRADVAVRSVNSRFLEIRFKLPPDLLVHEAGLRRRVSGRVGRGKVDVRVACLSDEPSRIRVRVNRDLTARYLDAVEELRSEFRLEGTVGLPDLLSVPSLLEIAPEESGSPEAPPPAVIEALDRALEAHDAARRREGSELREDLEARLASIEGLRTSIAGRAAGVPAAVRERLLERIRSLGAPGPGVVLDEGRLEQEVALMAEKADVTEELVRLESHLKAARGLIERADRDGAPVGRDLEFLLQEIGRETNTIGSKGSDLEITRGVLAIKSEIEKIREQVLNVE